MAVDFIQAYPQAPIETDMFMELPQGIETVQGSSKSHVLQLLSNLYGQKQAGRVWNSYLVDKLEEIGFKPSLVDDCVFYRDNVIFIVYVDDGIFICPDDDGARRPLRCFAGPCARFAGSLPPVFFAARRAYRIRRPPDAFFASRASSSAHTTTCHHTVAASS